MITKAEAQALCAAAKAKKQQEEFLRINNLIERYAKDGETHCSTTLSDALVTELRSKNFTVAQDPNVSCKYEIRWDGETE